MELWVPPIWSRKPDAGIKANIEVVKDGVVTEKLDVSGNAVYTFGRAADAVDFPLLHATASRRHFAVAWGPFPLHAREEDCNAPLGLYAIDLGATHGTFMGRGLTRRRLEPNVPVLLSTGSSLSFGESTRLYVCMDLPAIDAQRTATEKEVGHGVSRGILDVEAGEEQPEEEESRDKGAEEPSGAPQHRHATGKGKGGKKAHYLDELRSEDADLAVADGAVLSDGSGSVLSMLGGGGKRREGHAGLHTDSGPEGWIDKVDTTGLNEKERDALDRLRARMLRSKALTTECERIRAKESTQGQLTEGQSSTLSRNEGMLSDLEVEVEAQAEALRDRLEARRPGSTGLPVGATKTDRRAALGVDRTVGDDDDKVIDRTGGPEKRSAPPPRFALKTGSGKATVVGGALPAGALSLSTSSSSSTSRAPHLAPASKDKVETFDSLTKAIATVRVQMAALREEEEATSRNVASKRSVRQSSAVIGVEDELEEYLARTAMNEASAMAEQHASRRQGLQDEESRLQRLLHLVAPATARLALTAATEPDPEAEAKMQSGPVGPSMGSGAGDTQLHPVAPSAPKRSRGEGADPLEAVPEHLAKRPRMLGPMLGPQGPPIRLGLSAVLAADPTKPARVGANASGGMDSGRAPGPVFKPKKVYDSDDVVDVSRML